MKKIIFIIFYINFLKVFFLTSFTLVSIIWILQAVNFLDFISEDGHSLLTYFQYSLLNIPKIFVKTFLLSFFISYYYLLLFYENNNQLLIFWSNGILKSTFLKNMLIFTSLLYLIMFFFSFFFAPLAQNKARTLIKQSNLEFFPALIKEKKFIDTVENLTIFLDSKKDYKLQNILIKDSSNPNNTQIIISKKGILINKENQKSLNLINGIIINTNLNKKNTILKFEQTSFDLNEYSTKSVTDIKIQELSSSKIIKCVYNIYIKKQFLNEQNCQKENLNNLNQEIYKRIFIPICIFIILVITTFIIIKAHNDINYSIWKFKIFIYSILIVILTELSVNLIDDNLVKNLVVLSLLPMIFFFSYSLFLKKSNSTIL